MGWPGAPAVMGTEFPTGTYTPFSLSLINCADGVTMLPLTTVPSTVTSKVRLPWLIVARSGLVMLSSGEPESLAGSRTMVAGLGALSWR